MPYFIASSDSTHAGFSRFSPLDWTSISEESTELMWDTVESLDHYHIPMTRETTAQKFRALADVWQSETIHISSPSKIALHPAYQQIIGMGLSVLPYILRDLQREPKQWFWALNSITGVNPVSAQARGRINQMVEAWLQWGREQHYV